MISGLSLNAMVKAQSTMRPPVAQVTDLWCKLCTSMDAPTWTPKSSLQTSSNWRTSASWISWNPELKSRTIASLVSIQRNHKTTSESSFESKIIKDQKLKSVDSVDSINIAMRQPKRTAPHTEASHSFVPVVGCVVGCHLSANQGPRDHGTTAQYSVRRKEFKAPGPIQWAALAKCKTDSIDSIIPYHSHRRPRRPRSEVFLAVLSTTTSGEAPTSFQAVRLANCEMVCGLGTLKVAEVFPAETSVDLIGYGCGI